MPNNGVLFQNTIKVLLIAAGVFGLDGVLYAMGMSKGILPMTFWGYVVVVLVVTHITIAAVTIFLHRHQAHRALELHPVVSHFFRMWLWMTTGMVTKAWAAIHRKHHKYVETAQDPHSPQIKGIKKVLLEGAELYKQEAANKETLEKFGHGTPDDWLERRVYTPHSGKGLMLLLVLNVCLFGVAGVPMWGVQMLWIPFFAAGVINGIGHWWGYRNYDTPDASTNIVPWGILIGGEELHNNHHTFASSAKLSDRWFEFDIGWVYIRLLSFFGLAKVKKRVRRMRFDPEKEHIDLETLVALVRYRFRVGAYFKKHVMGHVEGAKKASVYAYMERLHEIATKHRKTEESIAALERWYHDAQSSGIEVLKRFADDVRSLVSVDAEQSV